MKLTNKVAVVTGASGGIGRETARAFAARGTLVAVAARRRDRLAELAREIEAAGGKCLVVPTDVAEPAQVQRLLDATLEHYGRVDIWVNNAGSGLSGSVEQTRPDEMEALWAVNYQSAFNGCQAALRQMRRQGGGHIVNVSSLGALFPLPLNGAYTATKCAMLGLSEALSLELAGSGIHVTAVCPGLTDTGFTEAMVKKLPDAPARKVPVAPPSAVAERIVRCVERPGGTVYLIPGGRLTVALCQLFPGMWRRLAARYIRERTAGRGVPNPLDEAG